MRPCCLVVAFLSLASATRASDTSLAERVKTARQTVERIRGRAFRSPVAAEEVAPERMRSLVEEKLREGLPVAPDLYFRTLAALGTIDRGDLTDLFPRLLDFYSRQILAFYDPESGKFFVARDAAERTGFAGSVAGDLIFVHELTHALQDQYMNLQSRLVGLKDNGDEALALECVMEGEATEVMIEAAVEGVPGADDAVGGLFASNLADLDPESGKVPQFFTQQLFFPYSDGTAFVRTIRKRDGWKAIDRLWEALPKTTSAILHPGTAETAFATFPTSSAPAGYRMLYSDTIGEWTLRFLLRRWAVPSADSRAASWSGDRFTFYDHDGKIAFQGQIRFADSAAAESVAAAWRKARPPVRAETRGNDLFLTLGFETPGAENHSASPRPSGHPSP